MAYKGKSNYLYISNNKWKDIMIASAVNEKLYYLLVFRRTEQEYDDD